MGKKTKRKKKSRKKQVPSKSARSKKLPIIIFVVALVAAGGYFFYDRSNRIGAVNISGETPLDIEALKGGETRATLSPVLFVGRVAKAYHLAKKNRELLDSMYCYCNCKKNIGHKSLLSCYVDRHAADCEICMDQTFYACELSQKGDTIAQVRNSVDKKFWRPLM
jgi:hypothetical protein